MRIPSIEVARAVAIFCVVLIHTAPFLRHPEIHDNWYYLGQIIQQITSFAVPFFFIAAGYFFSFGIKKYGLHKQLKRYVLRIFILLSIWIFIDGIFWGDWLKAVLENGSLKPLLWNITAVPSFAINRPDLFFLRGTAVPLWFLVSLIAGILFLSILIYLKFSKITILFIGSTLYLITLAVSSYSDSLMGFGFTLPREQRGIFLATFFLSIGYFSANSEISINGFKLLVFSVILMFLESVALSINNNIIFIEHPFIFSTALVSFAVLLTAIQNPTFGTDGILNKIGLLSLGIYVVHTPILGALNYFRDLVQSPFWEFLFPIITFFLSILIVIILKQAPYLRKIV